MLTPFSSFIGLINSVAPNFSAHSFLLSFVSMAMTREALRPTAPWTTASPTAPSPKMATVSPSCTFAVLVLHSSQQNVERERREHVRCSVTRRESTTEEAGLVEGSLVRNGDDRVLGHDGVLREGTAAHEVEERLSLALEAGRLVRHESSSLSASNLHPPHQLSSLPEGYKEETHGTTEVRLPTLAELALPALSSVQLQ